MTEKPFDEEWLKKEIERLEKETEKAKAELAEYKAIYGELNDD